MGFSPEEERRINRWLWVLIGIIATAAIGIIAGVAYGIHIFVR